MADIICYKKDQTLAPAHDSDLDYIKKLPAGQPIRVTVKRIRNYAFLKKWFSLVKLAFDYWEPENLVGEKNFERFRKDIIILCGFYDRVVRLDGSTRVEPKSISFANMSEDEFEDLYSKTIDVIIRYALENYTKDELRSVVDQFEAYE